VITSQADRGFVRVRSGRGRRACRAAGHPSDADRAGTEPASPPSARARCTSNAILRSKTVNDAAANASTTPACGSEPNAAAGHAADARERDLPRPPIPIRSAAGLRHGGPRPARPRHHRPNPLTATETSRVDARPSVAAKRFEQRSRSSSSPGWVTSSQRFGTTPQFQHRSSARVMLAQVAPRDVAGRF
jgi:hypothetical protein